MSHPLQEQIAMAVVAGTHVV